jgi:photosystem II stability/assembly factor-like uncharacterized protein
MRTRTALVLGISLLAWSAAAAAVPDPTWEALGPWGGSASLVAQAPGTPDILYAATGTGAIFTSADHGRHWRFVSDQFAGDFIRDVVVDPSDPAVAYATTVVQPGVLKSLDGGASWIPHAGVDGRLVNPAVLAIDPSDPRVIYVATFRGPYRSLDAGTTWEPTGSALAGQSPFDLLAVAAPPGTVLAAADSGLWRSTDHGTTWTTGAPGIPPGQGFLALAADPSAPTTLYAAAHSGQLYRSDDGGGSWRAVTRAPAPFADSGFIQLAVGADGSVYALTDAVLARSTDHGVTFGPLPLPGPAANDFAHRLAADPVSPGRLVAAMFSGLLVSDDSGATWRPASRGFAAREVAALALGAGDPAVLWVSVGQDGVKVRLPGERWPLANGDLPTADVPLGPGLAVDPRHRSRVWRTIPAGVARSDDGGRHWTALAVPDDCALFGAPALDPIHTETVYLAGTLRSGPCPRSFDHSWKSLDAGRTWHPLPIGAASFVVDPLHPRVLYALNPGLSRSDDGGATWREINPAPGRLNALAIDPLRPTTLYVATDNAILKSPDSGHTWHPATANLPHLRPTGLAADPHAPHTLYALLDGAGAFVTRDGAATWSPLGANLPLFYLGHLLLDPADPTHLYALTDAFGVFRLTLPAH